ncbi:MAG: hypothetical protein WDM88_01185 [Galbitalea sp.]
MALLHKTGLVPSKLELIAGWAPTQPWFEGDRRGEFVTVASYRFDDPAGEVGVETLLVRAGDGPVLHIPLTYRGAPLEGAEEWFIGTMEHGVLGTRWTYDALGDPVYLATLAETVLTGGRQADQFYEIEGKRVDREPSALVNGTGVAGARVPSAGGISTRNDLQSTLAETDDLTVLVARLPRLRPLGEVPSAERLIGTWTGQPEATTLALVSLRG